MLSPPGVFGITHFCDHQGPKIIFVTERFKNQSSEESSSSGYYGNSSKLLKCKGGRWSDDVCTACTSIPVDIGLYITNDHDSKTSYVSSAHSLEKTLFSRLEGVAFRIHSCESFRDLNGYEKDHGVTSEKRNPGKIGVTVVSDDNLIRGTVFVLYFSIKDSASKGMSRTYGIFFLTNDKFWIFKYFEELESRFRSLAEYIQNKSYQKYLQEEIPTNELRGLDDLTTDPGIYPKIHCEFIGYYGLFRSTLKREKISESFLFQDSTHIRVALPSFENLYSRISDYDWRRLIYHCCSNGFVNIKIKDEMMKETLKTLTKLFSPPKKSIDETSVLSVEDSEKESSSLISLNPSSDSEVISSFFSDKAFKILRTYRGQTITFEALEVLKERFITIVKIYYCALMNGGDKESERVLSSYNMVDADKKVLKIWTQSL